jgi:tetratricopeptide (TPR) repeat protein
VVLEKAAALDQKTPDLWSGWAAYHMQRGEYAEAFQDAERALAIDKKHLPALSTKTHLLYATKQFPEAYELSQKLLERVPDDPNLLFYHAKIAHEVHAYKAEIEALEKIIAQATAAGRPLSGYQMYLGQAYMAKGDAVRAVEVFTKVLQDPELPSDQADFARESIARIRKKTGI